MEFTRLNPQTSEVASSAPAMKASDISAIASHGSCQRDDCSSARLLAGTDEKGQGPLPIFSLIAGGDPHGGDAKCPESAIAAQR